MATTALTAKILTPAPLKVMAETTKVVTTVAEDLAVLTKIAAVAMEVVVATAKAVAWGRRPSGSQGCGYNGRGLAISRCCK